MICPNCKEQFSPKYKQQKYCSRKCQIRYNADIRPKYKPVKKARPNWVCQNCGYKIKLKFAPLRSVKKWFSYRCPRCGKVAVDKR